jgi:transposase
MNISEQQKEFLNLCVVEQLSYKTIAEKLGVPNSTLTIWYEELKEERLAIATIRTLWTRKKIKMAFSDFYKWYQSRERKCTYCEITEAEIKELIDTGRLTTKRLTTRGRKLELERKQSELEYDNFENLAFACYWCNNAKTDTFSEEEFLKVGSVFKEIWKQRLG